MMHSKRVSVDCRFVTRRRRELNAKHLSKLAISVLPIWLALALVNVVPHRTVLAQNSPGVLDVSFGDGGTVLSNFGASSYAGDAIIQPDGKVVVVGPIALGLPIGTVVARYNGDGSFDTTFGTMGVTTLTSTSDGFGVSEVALQQDGKLVLAGGVGIDARGGPVSSPGDFALLRLNSDGSIDMTFGDGGFVRSGLLPAASLVIQSDGKIVTAGVANASGPPYLGVSRYNADGTADSDFGTDGRVSGLTYIYPSKIRTQSDGKLVVAGVDPGNSLPMLVRLDRDGSMDSSFGASGIVRATNSNQRGFVNGFALQQDGKIVIVGTAVSRYDVNGALDQSFGSGGVVANDGLGFVGYSTAIQEDGRIVVSGARIVATPGQPPISENLELVRYNSDGSLDTSFGTSGIVITQFSPKAGAPAWAGSVLIQRDGKILEVGSVTASSGFEFALARYEAGVPASDFSLTFSQASLAVERGSKVEVQAVINRTGGFGGPVTVTAPDGLPKGIVVEGDGTVATSPSSAMFKFKVKEGASAGTNYFTFTAIDAANRIRTATLTLNVQ